MLQRTDGKESTALKNDGKPIRNPYVVLREEFDDWAVLFDPDNGRGFGLNPAGVYVWNLLDGEHTTDNFLKGIRSCAHDVPEEAQEQISAFIDELTTEGLVEFGSPGSSLRTGEKRPESFLSSPPGCEQKSFTYEPPKLIDLSGRRQDAYGGSCGAGSFASTNCNPTGNHASGQCYPGTSATFCYANGTAPFHTNCLPGACTDAECNYGTGARGLCDSGGSPWFCNSGSGGTPC